MVSLPVHALAVVAALLTLLPFFFAAFWPGSVQAAQRLPLAARMLAPGLLCVPYAMVAGSYGQFRWSWFALYALLPVVMSLLLYRASLVDPEQRGDWRGFFFLPVFWVWVASGRFEPAGGPPV